MNFGITSVTELIFGFFVGILFYKVIIFPILSRIVCIQTLEFIIIEQMINIGVDLNDKTYEMILKHLDSYSKLKKFQVFKRYSELEFINSILNTEMKLVQEFHKNKKSILKDTIIQWMDEGVQPKELIAFLNTLLYDIRSGQKYFTLYEIEYITYKVLKLKNSEVKEIKEIVTEEEMDNLYSDRYNRLTNKLKEDLPKFFKNPVIPEPWNLKGGMTI